MTRAEAEFNVPFALVVVLLAGFVAGTVAEKLRSASDAESMPSPSQMRSELIAKCVASPDAIAEIEQRLPDNETHGITPATVRQVLRDVVSKC